MARFPLGFLYILADIVYYVNYLIVRYRYRVVIENISKSFPQKSTAEIRSIAKKYYHHLADLMAETLKNLEGDKRTLKTRMDFVNLDVLTNLLNRGHSIILYVGHYGNWEWLAILADEIRDHKTIAFYQPLSNPVFDDLIKQSRQKYGVHAIPSSQAFRALKQYHEDGVQTLSIVLGDQSPTLSGQKVWINFLGRPTAFLQGANKIARKLDYKVLYPHFVKISRGNYQIEFKPIEFDQEDEEDFPILKKYAALLEKSIEHDPTLWLWSHRRWKIKSVTGN